MTPDPTSYRPTSYRPTSYRDVHAQNFVGRDQINNIDLHFTGEQMQALLDQLLPLLHSGGVQVQDGQVSAQLGSLALAEAQAQALGAFLIALPTESAAQREEHYLVRLIVDPAYRQWHGRYVPLSGGYRTLPHLTPQYSKILVRGDGPQRQIERVHLPDIRDALNEHPAFILLADPGGGKTTVLQRLTLDLAMQMLEHTGQRLPFFVRLAAQKSDETPHDFLARMWRQELPGLHADPMGEFNTALQEGRLCILADALNEARREGYAQRTQDWADFARHLPAGNRLIFSCRTQDYAGDLRVQQVEVDPLTPEQILDFARRYLGAEQGESLWTALQGPHAELLPLARIPYYLLLIVESFAQDGDLPGHRARLFERFVARLFEREGEKRHPHWIDPAAQHKALGQLAFAMQSLGDGTQVGVTEAQEILPSQVVLSDDSVVETVPVVVLDLARSASLLAMSGERTIKFAHHLMQEYFAAEELLRRWQDDQGSGLDDLWRVPSRVKEMPAAQRGEWDPLPGPPTSGWEQTTILAAGLVPELVESVRSINPALAARCLLELAGQAPEDALAQSRQEMLERLGNVAIHLRSRIEAGLLLGQLGDLRFAVETVNGVQVILPPMVEIPASLATIGSRRFWDRWANNDERPRHTVQLAAYAIGQFPVTRAEYACFMAAGGYEEEAYWTEGGKYWLNGDKVPGEEDPADWWIRTWQRFKENPQEIERLVRQGTLTERDANNWRGYITWSEEAWLQGVRELYPEGEAFREPRFWHDEAFNTPSQPVVGVCWYEAMAYANWLASLTGQSFRLPTEPEWEWAARRGNRTFPWGNGWDDNRLNSLEGRVMRTTPVGIYPQGVTPDGIHDLSGNVWEWTATRYADYPYDSAADLENPDANGLRVGRGGGWSANRKMVRCGFRSINDPRNNNNYCGFRLARTSL